MNIRGRDFINLEDYTIEELEGIIDLAVELKAKIKRGEQLDICRNKTLLMYFEKPSLRTRLSFETGINKLGGRALFITKGEIDPGKRESIEDTARVMSKFVDGLCIRTFAHEDVERYAKWSNVPVINALTDKSHPCQIMADILTIKEYFKDIKKIKLAYIGDGNNVMYSLLVGCSMFGINMSVATPKGYEAPKEGLELANRNCEKSGSTVEVYTEAKEAVKGANVIYTDTWTSMGQEAEANIRRIVFKNYQVNDEITALADKNHIVMHCLPAHKGEEIDAETFERYTEPLFNQAENRRYVQMAIMAAIM